MNAARGGKCPRGAESTLQGANGTEATNLHLAAMRARFVPLAFILALPACSSQVDKELEAVKSARSVLAEWQLVEEQEARGRAQGVYTEQMRQMAKDELKTAAQHLSQEPDASRVLQQLSTGSPDAAALKRADSTLEPLEKRLEVS